MPISKKKIDWLVIGAIVIIILITRIPFATHFLFAWDSGTVALGTEEYNLAEHQPHPPGYVLYVLSAKVINYPIQDVNAVLVGISILSAAGAAIFLFLLGRDMYSRRAGIIAAALLIFSKNFWAYSEVAFSYTLQCFLAVAVVFFAYKLVKNSGSRKFLYLGSIVLAIGGGFRQDFIIFLIPLWLYITYRFARKDFWRAWGLIAAICLAWLGGMVLWAGGTQAYFSALFNQTEYVAGFSVESRGLLGFIENYRLFLLFLADSFQGQVLAIFFAGYLFTPKNIFSDSRLKIFLLWTIPAAAFYLFVHLGERGYLLTFFPVLFMIIAAGLDKFTAELAAHGKIKKTVWSVLLTLFVLFIIFLNGRHFLGSQEFLSAHHLRLQDESTAAKIEYISTFNPDEINFLDRENFKQLHYYFREYNIYPQADAVPADNKPVEDLMKKFPGF